MDFIVIEGSLKRQPSFLDSNDDSLDETSSSSSSDNNTPTNIDASSSKLSKMVSLNRIPSTSDLHKKKRTRQVIKSESGDDVESLDSSMVEIFEECFSSTDDESDIPMTDNDEKFLLYDFDLVPEQNMPINTNNLEIQTSLKCPRHHGKIAIPWNINVRVVSKLDDIVAIRHDRMMITAASQPFHVEWCNSGWTQFCGWSVEEVLGMNCAFMQGMGTDKNVVKAFMEMLEMSGGFADMTIVNYSKYHTVLRNTIHCFPISDNCGFSDQTNITHIGCVLLDSQEITNPSMCDELIKKNPNLQFDRREQAVRYPYVNCTAAPTAMEWMNLAKDFTISLMLRYMMRSQGAIMLTDSYGKIVHTNIAWVDMTHFRFAEVESVGIMDMLGKKSKQSDVKKIAAMFESTDMTVSEFKKPYSAKYMCNLELFIKRRIGKPVDAFKDFVRKTPAQLAKEKDPCQFCQIYDENSEKMSKVMDTMPVYVSVVRFNSEHIAYLFTERTAI